MNRNHIRKSSIENLGFNFIPSEFIPKGKDEYYIRNQQNQSGIQYRNLTAFEIEVLVRNRNTSANWNKVLVSDSFNPELVKNCKFFGLVRISKLEPLVLEFSDFKAPVGLYNSTIISCDFGDNVVVDHVNYISHYIVGNEVILVNVNEICTTNHAKFGNGILTEGETEDVRVWIELCNENGGRKVLPFNGMLAGDAYLWSKYREDEVLQQKFKELTENQLNTKRGFYGMIGDRTVIKNTAIIKDVWIGDDAYIKGANKLKNLTINSGREGKTQIGEGCELVNGIIDFGCRIFYGCKAVRFVMASHSQLKYGARLINSYLGNNATISCCEVLNALIYPSHEQHHNNSFLCAALVMGQSNIAAGATLGSNHNSRAADGEALMGRGFWPGLCVSIKHNSKFASFSILAKGDYPSELNIPIPFSLISNQVSKDELHIMPGYWFMYNMYALERNSLKAAQRDKRVLKIQQLEYNYLAPDTVTEIVEAIELLKIAIGKAWYKKHQPSLKITNQICKTKSEELIASESAELKTLEVVLEHVENSRRKVVVNKAAEAVIIFEKLIKYYTYQQLITAIKNEPLSSLSEVINFIKPKYNAFSWMNIGGQLIPSAEVEHLLAKIKQGKIGDWNQVHQFYLQQAEKYSSYQLHHALSIYAGLFNIANLKKHFEKELTAALDFVAQMEEWFHQQIIDSRKKDYTSKFRTMMYDNEEQMKSILGDLSNNSFIKEHAALKAAKLKLIKQLKRKFK